MRTALFNVVSDPKLVVLMIVLSQVVAIASAIALYLADSGKK